ncbi:hypothetical protein AAG906_031438 [Vitis piasezkii]
MKNLQKLSFVKARRQNRMIQELKNLTKLRKLGIVELAKEDGNSLWEPLELDAMTNPRVFFNACISKGTCKENPIAALQNLPNLIELQLLDAYTGTQLDFNSGKFQKLKILDLEQLKQLRFIIMEDGTLPCLQKLIIRQCNELKHVPVGIDGLHHLNELHLCDMPEKFVAQLKKRGGELRHLLHRILHILSYQQGQLVEDLS